jgi:hypothetical protein
MSVTFDPVCEVVVYRVFVNLLPWATLGLLCRQLNPTQNSRLCATLGLLTAATPATTNFLLLELAIMYMQFNGLCPFTFCRWQLRWTHNG